MAEKVKVTKEQAIMIENHRNSFETLMLKRTVVTCPTHIDSLSIENVVRAYFDGYEIEQTPKEKLYDLYKRTWDEYNRITDFQVSRGGQYENGFAKGIEITLNTLEIKIKGINE